jgi:hypothetical protein
MCAFWLNVCVVIIILLCAYDQWLEEASSYSVLSLCLDECEKERTRVRWRQHTSACAVGDITMGRVVYLVCIRARLARRYTLPLRCWKAFHTCYTHRTARHAAAACKHGCCLVTLYRLLPQGSICRTPVNGGISAFAICSCLRQDTCHCHLHLPGYYTFCLRVPAATRCAHRCLAGAR